MPEKYSQTDKFPEIAHVMSIADLKKKTQDTYDETRKLAQAHKWEEHISVATPMIPVLHYLGYTDWVSRMLGRLAWSYVRLRNFDVSDKLLYWAETYDKWQAAANYYWACEYAHRAREEAYAKKCLSQFERLAVVLKINGGSSLELAVSFYKKLQEVEQESSFFSPNNKSDRARYLELRARLNQNELDFRSAATLYSDSNLKPYAACCRAFFHLTIALKSTTPTIIKQELEKAYNELVDTLVFADDSIKLLLIKFIEARIILCDLMLSLSSNNVKRITIVEEKYKTIYDIFFSDNGLFDLAGQVKSFFDTHEWGEVGRFVDSFKNSICPDDLKYYEKLGNLFARAQIKLPSYSFLTN